MRRFNSGNGIELAGDLRRLVDIDSRWELILLPAAGAGFCAFVEPAEVGRVGLGAIGLSSFSITRHAIAFDVAQVRQYGISASLLQHHKTRFDDHAPRVGSKRAAR